MTVVTRIMQISTEETCQILICQVCEAMHLNQGIYFLILHSLFVGHVMKLHVMKHVMKSNLQQ